MDACRRGASEGRGLKEGLIREGIKLRARRALERQLDYQRLKSAGLEGREEDVIASMVAHSRTVRAEIERVAAIAPDARVLEVGSGAHGLIFFFDAPHRVGIDPLADDYRELFPAWQHRAKTIAAFGEAMPFDDASFDIVLCDNVVDHAENPRKIVQEIARVLAPGGTLYFTVNIHHPFYALASNIHASWRALGIPLEITPFADHTVHLTRRTAPALFDGLPFTVVTQSDDIEETTLRTKLVPPRHLGDRLKLLFFKNASWKMIAIREPTEL